MQLKWNSNWIQILRLNSHLLHWIENFNLNSNTIELGKKKGMQIGAKGNEYLFVISIICDYGVGKKNSQKTKIQKNTSA